MLKKKHIFISLFLLSLFVAYQASITMFAHVHYVNGVMIVHSHPSTTAEHTHSESQILTLAHVAEWGGVEPSFVVLTEAVFFVCETFEVNCQTHVLEDLFSHSISLRAPPFCF